MQSGALADAGAVMGCAEPGNASDAPARPCEMFPAHRIDCIGRNDAVHAIEMGLDPTRKPPFFFQQSSGAMRLVLPGQVAEVPQPSRTKNRLYEAG